MKLLIIFLLLLTFNQTSFKQQQLQFPRVRTAYAEKEELLNAELQKTGFTLSNLQLYLRAFKLEKQLEVWVKKTTDTAFYYFKSYPFCALSGEVGPKRRQGDGQVPEGFYHISRFNPQSNFYLSLGINYPNTSDKILGHPNPGGDIFIHGSCVTIGCIPITDDKIKELYLLCVEARTNGQEKIPVHIFPMKLSDSNRQLLDKKEVSISTKELWSSLKKAYDYFEKNKIVPNINISSKGYYIVNK